MSKIVEYPEELDMLQAFSLGAKNSEPEDGYWCYEFVDDFGVKLKFSFDVFEGSIQTVLSFQDRVVQIVLIEGQGNLRLERRQDNYILLGHLLTRDTTNFLEIQVKPKILVKWSSLTEPEK